MMVIRSPDEIIGEYELVFTLLVMPMMLGSGLLMNDDTGHHLERGQRNDVYDDDR